MTAPNLWVLPDKLVPSRENVLARCGDVERRLSMRDDPPEFTPPFGTDDRCIWSPPAAAR
jgi:hypothetical protein